MRVVLYLRGITKGGVGRFINEVVCGLSVYKNIELIILSDEKFSIDQKSNIKISRVNTNSKILFDYYYSKKYLRKLKPDVVIYPKNVIPSTHKNGKWKKCVIIHDLGYFEKELNAYPLLDTLFMRMNIPRSCKIADTVFTVSEYTKKDLLQRIEVSESKLKVIGEGVHKDFFQEKMPPIVDKPYFFYAGSLSPRKNLSRVLEAFNSIVNKVPHHLYITGLKNWGDISYIDEYESIKDRIHILGYISEKDLLAMYQHADALVFPSLYEGFGLPILEAQAAGCPVITSNVTACPETAGDAALIVNPYSVEEIADAMYKIYSDPKFAQQMVERGNINLKRFSWQKTADIIVKSLK